jgi:Tol biopolymer transport system component
MTTGKRAFERQTVVDSLAAVLSIEPDLKQVPAKVRRLAARCLEKDAKKRLRDISAWKEVAIDELTEVRPTSRLPWIAAVAVLLLALAGVTAYFLTRPAPRETRTDIVTPPSNDSASFALSPDGSRIAYSAIADGVMRLFVRPLDSAAAQPLAGTEGAFYPFWSPDSRSVGFFANGKIKRVDLSGGSPQTLADSILRTGAAWSAQGVILFEPGPGSGLSRVPASGGQAAPVTKLGRGQGAHRHPYFLPDGKHFLFYVAGTESGIYLGSLDGGDPMHVTAADSAGEYLNSGWLLWVQQNALLARRFDPSSGRFSGDPVNLAQPVPVNGTFAGAFSVSNSGLIAWRSGQGTNRQLMWFTSSGERAGALGSPDDSNLLHPELSPDGRRVAVSRGQPGTGDIWLMDAARPTRFTFDTADDRYETWSPDGSRIAFASNRRGHYDLYVKSADGSAAEQVMLASEDSKRPDSWSPDGKFILYWSNRNNGDLMVLPLEGGGRPYPFVSTPSNEQQGAFSPGGRWVAYQSNESGRDQVYVRPFPGPGGVWQISSDGGAAPRWAKNGKELYYIAPGNRMMAAAIGFAGSSIVPGQPAALFTANALIPAGATRPQYDVARDGRFLLNIETAPGATAPITLLQNWKPPK